MSNDHSGQPAALEAGKSPDHGQPVVIGSGGGFGKWRVHGICFVPMEAEAIVEAATEEEAMSKARALWQARKQDLIVGNSSDEGAAFEWEPTAEALPNTEVTHGPLGGRCV